MYLCCACGHACVHPRLRYIVVGRAMGGPLLCYIIVDNVYWLGPLKVNFDKYSKKSSEL